MRTVALGEYQDLMRAFAERRMGASDFETRYLRLFKEDASRRPPRIFHILDRLFADVDAFSADPALRGEDGLDEPALRVRVTAALREIETGEA